MSIFLHRLGLLDIFILSGGEPTPMPEYIYYEMRITGVNGGTEIACDELQLLDADGNNIASKTERSGTGEASSFISYFGDPIGLYEAEGDEPDASGAGWITASGTTGWTQWIDDSAIDCVGMAMAARALGEASRMPKDFTIQYSDDGSAWNTALTVTNETGWSDDEDRIYSWTSVGAHRWWRLDCTANNGGVRLGIKSIRYFEADGEVITASVRKSLIRATNYWSDFSMPRMMFGGGEVNPGPGNLTLWLSASGNDTSVIKIHTGLPTSVTSFKYWVAKQAADYHNDRCPTDFTIHGSNNNVDWDLLRTVSGLTDWADTPKTFTLVNPNEAQIVLQTYDIADYSSGAYITIEEIDGVPLSDFAYIYGYFVDADNAATGTMHVQFSVDGSTWRAGASEYKVTRVNATDSDNYFLGQALIQAGGEPFSAHFLLSDIGVVAPTSLRSREISENDTQESLNISRSQTPVIDTAIRFFEGALGNWVSGSLTLVGVKKGDATVQSHDFAAIPQATKVFNVPEGHTIGMVNFVDGVSTNNASLRVRLGTGDTFLTDYNGQYMTAASSSTFGLSEMPMTYSADNDQNARLDLWGLNTMAPVVGFSKDMAEGTNGGMWTTVSKSNVAYDQIEVSHNAAGNFTAGVLYFVTYAAITEVETVDFTTDPAVSHDFTGLSDYHKMMVIAPILDIASAAEVRAQVSTDGITFDSGASDYRNMLIDDGQNYSEFQSFFRVGPGAYSSHGFVSTFAGFGQDTYLNAQDCFIIRRNGGSTAQNTGGIRRTKQVNTALRIFNSAAVNFDGGKMYRVGFNFTPIIPVDPVHVTCSLGQPQFTILNTQDDVEAWQGVAFDGEFYYTAAYRRSDYEQWWLFKWDANFNYVMMRNMHPEMDSQIKQINGVYFDTAAQKLFVCANNFNTSPHKGWVLEVDRDDFSVTTETELTGAKWTEGIVLHDGFWWEVNATAHEIRKFNLSFVLQDTYALPDTSPGSLFWSDLFVENDIFYLVWHEGGSGDQLRGYTFTGSAFVLETINVTAPTAQTTQGMYYDGCRFIYWAERDVSPNEGGVVKTTVRDGFYLESTPFREGRDGEAFAGFTISAAKGIPPYVYTVFSGALPDGVTLDSSSGVVSGTPTVDGTFADIVLMATDDNTSTAKADAFTMEVFPAVLLDYNVTVSASDIGSPLYGFPLSIDLSNMPAQFWTDVDADGGDIRAYGNHGTTELPLDMVVIDTGAETGYIVALVDLSDVKDTVITIKLDGGGLRAASHEFGRYNVWPAHRYEAVYAFIDNIDDRTANLNHLSVTEGSVTYGTGTYGIGGGIDTTGADLVLRKDGLAGASDPIFPLTMLVTVNRRTESAQNQIAIQLARSTGSPNRVMGIGEQNATSKLSVFSDSAGWEDSAISSALDADHVLMGTTAYGTDYFYVDGGNVVNPTAMAAPDSTHSTLVIGHAQSASYWRGDIGFAYVAKDRKTADWVYAENKMLSSNGTFVTIVAPVAHRYWRVYIAGPISGSFLGGTEIEMRATASGADETGSGTAIHSSRYNSSYDSSNAFDDSYIDSGGSPADIWVASQSAFPAWIGYDFGVGNDVEIVEVLYTGRESSRVNESPGNAVIEFSDNGTSWTVAWTPGAQSAWTDVEQRIWTK